MTEREALQHAYDMIMDKVFRMADNYLMTVPAKGCEREFSEARNAADILKTLLDKAEQEERKEN